MSKRTPPRPPRFDPSRRRFITRVAAASGAIALAGCKSSAPGSGGGPGPGPGSGALPNPEDSGIDHIVQVMMENRSFDHMLGWVPGANGRQAGLQFKNVNGEDIETFHLGSDAAYGYQGCGWADPAHGYDTGRVHYNNGQMDGWLLTPGTSENPADKFPVGYYTADDLLFYKGVAQHFTVCDAYFHGILNSTFPNRIYMHAGTTDRMDNAFYPPAPTPAPATIATIWDRLAAKGISARNYFSDLPLTALWGAAYADITAPFEQFLVDAAAGTLPSVSYFDPNFGFSAGEAFGVSRDDHPAADVRDGQVYLTEIYNALRASPNWERTLLIVTYDEWGGFFDHVVPPVKPVSAEEAALGNDGRLGFRTPCVILGPRARRGHVSSIQFDPQSVIDLITWRFGLDPLGARAGSAITNNMALALDFDNAPNLDAPDFGDLGPDGLGSHRTAPYGTPCAAPITGELPLAALSPAQRSMVEHEAERRVLFDMSKRYGFVK